MANKILIADDDSVSLKVLERYLQQWDFEPITAKTGKEALDLYRANTDINIAVLDWIMPELNGLELCKLFRREEDRVSPYLVLLTSRRDKRDLLIGFEAGADDYIIKPFNPLELHSRLKVGCRLVDSQVELADKNRKLSAYAQQMEDLAEERAKMLVHADRLASLGTLTAGVAHEINNPTTFISGNTQTIERCWSKIRTAVDSYQKNLPKPDKKLDLICDEMPKMLEGIRSGVTRITTIVKGLKSFSRTGSSSFEPCDLHEIIKEALLLCNNRLRQGIRIIRLFHQDLPMLEGDRQKLEQVIVNLLVNAADAIHQTNRPGELRIITDCKDEGVTLRIEDTGPGIVGNPDEIWKPFFTTKKVGDGTGLGLSISQGIIHDHSGTIQAENTKEGGAAFTVWLPVPGGRK